MRCKVVLYLARLLSIKHVWLCLLQHFNNGMSVLQNGKEMRKSRAKVGEFKDVCFVSKKAQLIIVRPGCSVAYSA